jgi:hypothetical protein
MFIPGKQHYPNLPPERSDGRWEKEDGSNGTGSEKKVGSLIREHMSRNNSLMIEPLLGER